MDLDTVLALLLIESLQVSTEFFKPNHYNNNLKDGCSYELHFHIGKEEYNIRKLMIPEIRDESPYEIGDVRS